MDEIKTSDAIEWLECEDCSFSMAEREDIAQKLRRLMLFEGDTGSPEYSD